MIGLFIGCIGTHVHGRQVMSVLSSCDNVSHHTQGHLEAYF